MRRQSEGGLVAGPLLVTGHWDGSVQVRDAGTAGAPLAHRVVGTEGVCSLAVGEWDGTVRVFTCDREGEVHGWRLPDLAAVGPILTRDGSTECLVTTVLDGRPVLVAGGYDRLRVWDPCSGAVLRDMAVRATIMAVVDDGVLVTADTGAADPAYLVDLAAGEVRVLPSRGSRVAPTAVAAWAGAQLIAGDDAGWVRRWDRATGRPIGEPWEAYELHYCLGRPSVHALAVGTVSGRPVLAAGGWDGEIRLWDLDTGARTGPQMPDGGDVPDGGDEPDDERWDGDEVNALGFVAGLLAAGGGHAVLRLWDPDTGTVVRRWRTGSVIAALAVAGA